MGARRLQHALVAGEIALAVVLVTGAVLLARSFSNLYEQGPGFRPSKLKSMYISLPTYEHQIRNGDEWQRIAGGLYQRTLAAVASAPGIQGVASVSHLPLAGFYYLSDFEVEGFSTDRNDPPRAIDRAVSSTYHETIGVPLREGRYFNAFDRAGSLPVVLVNEQFAKRFFHGRSAVGGRLRFR